MRMMMKQIVADVEDRSCVKSRVIPPAVLAHFEAKLVDMESFIERKLEEEVSSLLLFRITR